MAMVEMYEPKPEPEVITLGHAEIIFKGVSLEKIGEDLAELVAMEIAALINERLATVIGSDTGFATSEYEVSLETLTLELEGVFEGSIFARFKMIGAAMITSYGLIASYPSLKEAIPILTNDIGLVIQYLIDNAPKPEPYRPQPREFNLYFRSEDEMESEILEKKGF
jgi:hypothetical protein